MGDEKQTNLSEEDLKEFSDKLQEGTSLEDFVRLVQDRDVMEKIGDLSKASDDVIEKAYYCMAKARVAILPKKGADTTLERDRKFLKASWKALSLLKKFCATKAFKKLIPLVVKDKAKAKLIVPAVIALVWAGEKATRNHVKAIERLQEERKKENQADGTKKIRPMPKKRP